jgi:hypothetical protein
MAENGSRRADHLIVPGYFHGRKIGGPRWARRTYSMGFA